MSPPSRHDKCFCTTFEQEPPEEAPALSHYLRRLEVEAHLCRIRARRHKMRAAERRQEVIKRNFVRQVDHCKAQAPLVAISVEQVVVPDAEIKQVTRRDAGRIAIVVFGSRSR